MMRRHVPHSTVAIVVLMWLAATLGCSKSTSPDANAQLPGHWRYYETISYGLGTVDCSFNSDHTFTYTATMSVSATGTSEGWQPGTATGSGTWTSTSNRIYTTISTSSGSPNLLVAARSDSMTYVLGTDVLTLIHLPDSTAAVAYKQ